MYNVDMTDMTYKDDDFVYVDPDAKKAVGLVEWGKDGKPLPKEWPRAAREPKDGEKPAEKPRKFRKPKVRYYPWGSYRSMKKLYKIEGKIKDKDTEDYIQLEEAISKLQQDPYWD